MTTITGFLEADRVLCDRLFARVEEAVKRRAWGQADCAIDRFGNALGRHLAMEEDVLFAALEQYSSDARKPTASMRVEHKRLRQLAAEAALAVRRRKVRHFCAVAAGLRLMMEAHCVKEEGIVFLMADHFLRPAARFLVGEMQSLTAKPGPIGLARTP